MSPGEHSPAHAVAAGPIDLRQAAHRAAQRLVHQRGHRHELGRVVGHLVVDFIGEDHQVVLLRNARDRLEHCPGINGARRVVRVDHDDGARALRDQRLDFFRVRHEAALGSARIVDGPPAVQVHRRGPERVVGARDQHFLVRREQCPQREVDQFAHAVADEDVVGRDAADAPLLLLHHHGLACREDALLVAVAFGRTQVLDHRQPHGLGRAEAEGARVADIERDDVVTHPLHFLGATGELAADLVADVGETGAGPDGAGGHGRDAWWLAGRTVRPPIIAPVRGRGRCPLHKG